MFSNNKERSEIAEEVESEPERAKKRAETGEMKIIDLEEELEVVTINSSLPRSPKIRPTRVRSATRSRSRLSLPS